MSAARRRRKARRHGRLPTLAGVLALMLVLSATAWLALGEERRSGTDRAREEGLVRVELNGRALIEAKAADLSAMRPAQFDRWLARLSRPRSERRGRARVTLHVERGQLQHRLGMALRAGGGTLELPTRPVSTYIRLPVIKQALRNNCETAALAMTLAAQGVRVPQLELQRQLPRSGPLDPQLERGAELPVWGDPGKGFVGRADGGGSAGGYGVYEPPIKALAARHGARLVDLSRRSAVGIYAHLLSGRPVIAWVGLSDGPFMTWRTPGGRRVTGNFGEHTVVLTGVRGDRVFVNDPLIGERLVWTRAEFEPLWRRLGRRALGLAGPSD
jgi:uncharacterized protein YvpB